ncbi:hypothetical protein J4209_05050 [Candidatus Woesearchaeota archaeon]|nr:hypothetical protein [Candidatus Woesearchaeota archaeon]
MATQHSLFSKNPKRNKPVAAAGPDISDLSSGLRDIGTRLRILEERYTNLQTKTQITEQNMLSRNKLLSTEIKATNLDIHEIKRELIEIKDRILLLIKELQMCAKKEEVNVLEKYINLWEPVNFVTRNEVEDIINEISKKNQKL